MKLDEALMILPATTLYAVSVTGWATWVSLHAALTVVGKATMATFGQLPPKR